VTRAELIAAELRGGPPAGCGDGWLPPTVDHRAPAGADEDVQDLLDAVEAEHDWLVPGLLERGDRVITTGAEGAGKSTLLRQVGVQVASGIHPFSGEPTVPAKVLLVDLECSRRQVRRAMAPLVGLAGDRLDRGMLIPLLRPEGIDVLSPADARWLRDRVAANRPDLLIIGPVYKLAGGDPRDEAVARRVAQLLDELRVEHDLTVVIEAHQPYSASGGTRPLRPYGASLWSRWPEFGLHLAASGVLSAWRGARDERSWPAALTRGGEWPWTVQASPVEVLWARITEYVSTAAARPTERALADALGAGKGSVHRAIEAHRGDWDAMPGGSS
jgi:hypothetical protein